MNKSKSFRGVEERFCGIDLLRYYRWALNNPHITTYIPQNMRISKAAGKRRDGKPKRPPKSLAAILANLDILLHVSAFSRWPLKVHFFSARVFDIWNKTQRVTDVPLREDKIILDYRPVEDEAGQSQVPWGIRALPLAYSDMKEYIAKTKNIFKFEEQKNCLVCGKKLEPEHGIYAACSYAECNGIGHLKCWSQYLLGGTEGGGGEVEHILPLGGKCPSCHHNVHWGLMMKELSLRLRGQAEIEKLFKKQHKKRTCEVQDDEHDELSNVEDRAQEADESDEMDWEADLEWDDIPRG